MEDISITTIQTALVWENVDENLTMFSQKINAINDSTNIVVLPEMFSTGFSMNTKNLAEPMFGKTMAWMADMAKQKNCVVVGSVIITEKNKYYNRLIWMNPDGSFQKYDKRHLFRMANEQNFYAAGEEKLIIDYRGWKICPLICYDLRFPVWCRNTFNKKNNALEYEILLFVANWPERRRHAWKTLLQARAIENLSYVVGVNRVGNDGNEIYHSGDTACINYKGEVISSTKDHEERIETTRFSYQELLDFRKSFPAGLDADIFEIKK